MDMRKTSRHVLVAFLALALSPFAMAQEEAGESTSRPPLIWAELKPRVDVQGTRLLLGDIAEVKGTDKALLAEARALPVGSVPAPGSLMMLRKESVRHALSRQGRLARSILIEGTPETMVSSRGITLSGEDVLTLALAHLSRELGEDASSAWLTRTWKAEPLSAPAGRFSTRFEVTSQGQSSRGSGIVRIEVRPVVDGRRLPGRVVEFALRRKISVLVAAADLRARAHVDASDVTLERREVAGSMDEFITDPTELGDLVPKAAIRKGEVLRRVDFKRRPIVLRNQLVRVIYRKGALTIGGEGVAQGQGAAGDRIPVRVGKKKRTIFAVILDSKTVEAGPGQGEKR